MDKVMLIPEMEYPQRVTLESTNTAFGLPCPCLTQQGRGTRVGHSCTRVPGHFFIFYVLKYNGHSGDTVGTQAVLFIYLFF